MITDCGGSVADDCSSVQWATDRLQGKRKWRTREQRGRQKRCVLHINTPSCYQVSNALSLYLLFTLLLIASSLVMHSLMHIQGPSRTQTHTHTQTGNHYHAIPWCICLSLEQSVGRILIHQMRANVCVCVWMLWWSCQVLCCDPAAECTSHFGNGLSEYSVCVGSVWTSCWMLYLSLTH